FRSCRPPARAVHRPADRGRQTTACAFRGARAALRGARTELSRLRRRGASGADRPQAAGRDHRTAVSDRYTRPAARTYARALARTQLSPGVDRPAVAGAPGAIPQAAPRQAARHARQETRADPVENA